MPLFHPLFTHRSLIFTAALLFIFGTISMSAQTCDPPKIVANTNKGNLFTAEQEMILGELTLQSFAGEFRQIRDPELLAYLNNIGQRLIRHLPDSGIKFTFHLIDYPDANAFNIPGGHVFISRKLVAFANSEDELAFVIGHELGHGVVRHGTIDLSIAMSKILDVKSVGDRKDIIDKYNQLIEKARTKNVRSRSSHEDEQQIEADQIGFFAGVAAGYDPDASFSFYDRLTESEGKTGSWFSDLFGKTKPAQKRLREIAQSTAKLPAACREGRDAKQTAAFTAWQAGVVGARNAARAANVPGLLWKRELAPKLRSDVKRIEFSSDGRFLYAIDDTSISVIKREGMSVLFQASVENIRKASFASNNTELVFLTDDLRFERWNLERKEAVSIREVVVRSNCLENDLSPDGNFLACVDYSGAIAIIDTRTGQRVFKKEKFYEFDGLEIFLWQIGSQSFGSVEDEDLATGFFRIGFSPDSRYAVFSRSNKFRFRFKVDGLTVAGSENTATSVDLTSMKEQGLGGDLKKVAGRPFSFIAPDKIIGTTEPKLESGGVFSFPDGKRLTKLTFGGEAISPTGDPNFVVIKPMMNSPMGVFDIRGNSIAAGMNKKDVGVWGDIMAFESVSGKILLRKFSEQEIKNKENGADIADVDLPSSPLTRFQGSGVSDDLKWLMLSTKTRGGMWSLDTGERKMFTRGFWGGIVDGRGNGVAQFDTYGTDKAMLALLTASNGAATAIREIPESGVRQHGRFLLTRTKIKTQKEPERDEFEARAANELPHSVREEIKLTSNVTFELKDFIDNKVIWTRDFKGAVPRHTFHSYSGRLMLYWPLSSEIGKARVKEDPTLKSKADALGNKAGDTMVEVIDAFEGKSIATVFIESGNGSFRVNSGQSERDWLAMYDSEGRVLVFSLKTGDLRHRFFGVDMALNPTRDLLLIEDFLGNVTVHDLDSGGKVSELNLDSGVVFSRFNLAGDRLLMISENQTAYAFDVDRMKTSIKQP